MIPRRIFAVLLSLLTLSLGACSSNFDAKWKAAATKPQADPYSGRWAGEWKSTRGTHRDRLECILTKVAPARYMADFHAHWHGLSSSYTVPMATVSRPKGLQIRGAQDLGSLQGGVYEYAGVVTPREFRANYRSKYDTGVFQLRRFNGPR